MTGNDGGVQEKINLLWRPWGKDELWNPIEPQFLSSLQAFHMDYLVIINSHHLVHIVRQWWIHKELQFTEIIQFKSHTVNLGGVALFALLIVQF